VLCTADGASLQTVPTRRRRQRGSLQRRRVAAEGAVRKEAELEMEIGAVLLIVLHALIVFVSAVYISANRRPSAAIAWVLAIIFIPYLGAITFFIVGFGRLPRRRREKQREVNELMLPHGRV
jgi:hypothetical protein